MQGELDATTLVFLDETGTSLSMTPWYGWAPKGARAYGRVPAGHRRHHTLIGSLTLAGMGPSLVLEGSVDRATFDTYLTEVLVPTLTAGQTVILDNASIHKGTRTRQVLEAAGVRVAFLPTASPEFNPIEHACAKLKQHLRRLEPRDPAALEAAIERPTGDHPRRCSGVLSRCWLWHRETITLQLALRPLDAYVRASMGMRDLEAPALS